jgi:N-acetylmuramoyl-L-alanine amidase
MTIQQDLLTVNKFSRPGLLLKSVKGLVVHWYANPNTTAKQNRDFFEKRKNGLDGYGSAHYLIGLSGEIIQAIPENETAYHVGSNYYMPDAKKALSNYPNNCTIGIENAHIDWSGKFTQETYNSLIELLASLCKKYNLNETNIYRHYDITGKDCPKWFVVEVNDWLKLKNDVKEALK